jgi:hypothetical protein
MTARILPQRALTTDCFPRQNQAQGSTRERKAPELHRMRRVFHKRALLFALWQARGEAQMARYKIGDRVTWNSEAGRVSGTITKIHERGFQYKGHNRHASKEEPQYEIKSDKTDHVAAHKESALKKSG